MDNPFGVDDLQMMRIFGHEPEWASDGGPSISAIRDCKDDVQAIRQVVAPDVTGLVGLHGQAQFQNLSTVDTQAKKGHDYGDGNI